LAAAVVVLLLSASTLGREVESFAMQSSNGDGATARSGNGQPMTNGKLVWRPDTDNTFGVM
jgi:hypothetical protein